MRRDRNRRRTAVMACAAWLSLAGTASAALPPAPTVSDFSGLDADTTVSALTAYFAARGIDGYSEPESCGGTTPPPLIDAGGGDLGYHLVRCEGNSRIYIDFAQPQAYVGLNAIFLRSRIRPAVSLIAFDQSFGDGGVLAATPQPAPAAVAGRTPLVVTDPFARIKSVEVTIPTSEDLVVDDISNSRTLQPETEITAIAPSVGSAAFRFASSFGTQFRCAVDAEPVVACPAAFTRTALTPGPHRVTVAAVDPFGTVDPSPAQQAFEVPTPRPNDRDGDGVLDANDNCPDSVNADQADADADAIGNACEILPSGKLPPIAGKRSVVRAISGEVFVKLPRAGGARASKAEAGFVPLKGVASVPIGSTLDTRDGRAQVSTSIGRATRRTQAIVVEAGIARVAQARATRRSPRPFTDLSLLADPGAARACRARPSSRQVIGTLRVRGKGRYRVKARESIAAIRGKALLWTVQDRCDGTAVQVGRGTARIFDRGKSRTVTAKRGRRYIARGRLSGPLKGEPSS